MVEGRWQWGSFTRHATTIGAGVTVESDDGRRQTRFVFMNPADVDWVDTWHVIGLRGTGSCDYAARHAFIPDGHWVDLSDGEAPRIDRPLYRFSFFGLLAAGIAATAIGMAQAALDAFVELAEGKVPQGSARTLAQRAGTQADTARAEATIRSSTAFLRDASDSAWDRAAAGDAMTVDDRRLLRLASTDATQRCADAVNRLYRTAGGEAVYERCPIEKLFRDVNVATQHAMVAERLYETSGRLTLGLETDTAML
jgi:alkylation response protein AidB-like acyl-CoA dehydrogenase